MTQQVYATYRKRITNLSSANLADLRKICELNRILFNLSMQKLQLAYQKSGHLLSFQDILALIKPVEEYQWVQAWAAQQIIKMARRQFRDFFNLQKKLETDYRYHRIKFPFLVPEYELLPIIIGSTELNLKGDYFILPVSREFRKKFPPASSRVQKDKTDLELHKVPIYLPKFLVKDTLEQTRKGIKEIRVLPRYGGHYFYVEFVYEAGPRQPRNENLNYRKTLKLILVDDVETLVVGKVGKKEVLRIGKKEILEVQQFFWDKKSNLVKIYQKQNIKTGTKRLAHLSFTRDQKIKAIHIKQISEIVEYLLDNQIGNVIMATDFTKPDIKRPEVSSRNFLRLLRNACLRNGVFLKDPPSLS